MGRGISSAKRRTPAPRAAIGDEGAMPARVDLGPGQTRQTLVNSGDRLLRVIKIIEQARRYRWPRGALCGQLLFSSGRYAASHHGAMAAPSILANRGPKASAWPI